MCFYHVVIHVISPLSLYALCILGIESRLRSQLMLAIVREKGLRCDILLLESIESKSKMPKAISTSSCLLLHSFTFKLELVTCIIPTNLKNKMSLEKHFNESGAEGPS